MVASGGVSNCFEYFDVGKGVEKIIEIQYEKSKNKVKCDTWYARVTDERQRRVVEADGSLITPANRGKNAQKNRCLSCFYKLYCKFFWSPFLRDLESFCKKLF